MRTVTFVSGLVLEQRPLLNQDDLRTYHIPMSNLAFVPGDMAIELSEVVEERVVPIHRLKRVHDGRIVETYIAYSREVQELLEMPFDSVKKQLEATQDVSLKRQLKLEAFRNASLWGRFKFAWHNDLI